MFYNRLKREDIRDIVDLQLRQVVALLEEKVLSMKVDPVRKTGWLTLVIVYTAVRVH